MLENKVTSDFLKLAYKYGRVKNVEEAFKEYDVKDEWHKGDINKVLKNKK